MIAASREAGGAAVESPAHVAPSRRAKALSARREPWWTESRGAGWASAAVAQLRPWLPHEWARYLPGTRAGGQCLDNLGKQPCAESWASSATHRSTS